MAATKLPPRLDQTRLDPAKRDRVKTRADTVPAFALYGEPGVPGVPDVERLHLESIASRSQRYRWEIDAHRHHGLHQILWLRAGAAQVSLDEQRHSCSGPAVVVIPPGVVHAFRFEPHTDGCVLTFSAGAVVESDLAAAGSALRLLFAAPRLLLLAGDEERPRFEGLINQLAEEFNAADSAGSPVPLWLARAVVWRLAQWVQCRDLTSGPAARSHQALFTRFAVLVEDHYTEHWPVARYAGQLGVSPERLNRLVRSAGGGSALERIHQRLTREACRRLVYVAAPISQLAFELGFEDPAYFCRFFKRRLGCSPSSYRQRGAVALSAHPAPTS